MLDTLTDFLKAVLANSDSILQVREKSAFSIFEQKAPPEIGDLYCPVCGAPRKVRLTTLYIPVEQLEKAEVIRNVSFQAIGRYVPAENITLAKLTKAIAPSLFTLECLQCACQFTAMIATNETGPSLLIVSAKDGGLRTPHTPAGVAFYLDQAQRAASAGATSAAVAMYRAALEQLLFEQGFTVTMLGKKLNALQTAIETKSAPKWAIELEPEILKVINELGNGAIHPNDGNVERQRALDGELLSQLVTVFTHLLFYVYDLPHQKAAMLGSLKARAAILRP